MNDLLNEKILRISTNAFEAATIIDLSVDRAKTQIDDVWWEDENLSEDACLEADRHWRWERIAKDFTTDVSTSCLVILSTQGYLEGAIAYRVGAESKLEPSKECPYVGWLASAPRNRPKISRQQLYRGVGSSLVYRAVKESYSSGFAGRVFLQSLPTEDTVRFYRNKGFTQLSQINPITNLIDFELSQSTADRWLKELGDLP